MHAGITTETREGSLPLSQHIPFLILRDSSSKLKSFRAWKPQPQALPAAPNFCTSGSRSEIEGFLPHRFDTWKDKSRIKAGINGIILPSLISHGTGVWGRAVNGRCEESIKNSFFTTSPHGKQHMLGLRATGTPSDPIQAPAALLTLWTCGPSAPQNDRSHSSDAGRFLI